MLTQTITQHIEKAMSNLGYADVPVQVSYPEMQFGDMATSVAFALAKKEGKPVDEVAASIAKELEKVDSIASAKVVKGFVNITLTDTALLDDVRARASGEYTYTPLVKERIAVEYTDPNPFKEFHIGHMMTNSIGESFARIAELLGAEVVRMNYQGDVGLHVAKAVWGLQKQNAAITAKSLGEAYAAGATAYDTDEEAKKEIQDINAHLYNKDDTQLNELYDKGKKVSLEAFEEIYAMLGTAFDAYYFESDTGKVGLQTIAAHSNIFEESEGATVYKGEQDGLHTRVFITGKGLPTYEAKEIGLTVTKQKEYPNHTFYVVTANEIIGMMKVVNAVIKKIDSALAEKVIHIPHGILKLSTGKMSSRTGDVVKVTDMLDEVADVVKQQAQKHTLPEETVRHIALASVRFSILQQASDRDVVFDMQKATSFEGDTGPYLQYSLVRAYNILKEADAGNAEPYMYRPIVTLLHQFDAALEKSYRTKSSHHLTQFLLTLAHEWNSFYAKEKVLQQEGHT